VRPLPPGFQEALSARTAITPIVDVQASLLGRPPIALQVAAGRISIDARRNVRSDGDLSIMTTDHPVGSPADVLTPFGAILTVRLGVGLPDGTSATVPAGVFIVDSSDAELWQGEQNLRHGHMVHVKLVDLAKRLIEYRFESPFTTSAGSDLATVVSTVVADRIGSDPALPLTGVVLTQSRTFGLDPEIDPWVELVDLCRGFGYSLFYDLGGTLRLMQESPTGVPRPLAPNTVSTAYDRRPPNVVIARGEPTDLPPVQAIAIDDDPASPTYAGTGPGTSAYGRVTRFYASPALTTVAAAQAAADTILARELRIAASWTVARSWDPTLDPFDVIAVDDEHGPIVLQIDAVTINIGGDTVLEARSL
jgi:hypothetical protein